MKCLNLKTQRHISKINHRPYSIRKNIIENSKTFKPAYNSQNNLIFKFNILRQSIEIPSNFSKKCQSNKSKIISRIEPMPEC